VSKHPQSSQDGPGLTKSAHLVSECRSGMVNRLQPRLVNAWSAWTRAMVAATWDVGDAVPIGAVAIRGWWG
jgi:hypothetical protein